MKRYSHGSYRVQPGRPDGHQIESYIVGRKFLHLEEKNRVYTRNRQHRLYAFHLAEIDREVVLKIHWLDPSYSLLRRLDIWISRLFKNRCKGAFDGALALQRAGIGTFTPLAYWSYKKSRLITEKYLLYEKIEASFSISQYRKQIKNKITPLLRRNLDLLIEGMAEITAKMHQSNLRHADLAFCNFLVDTTMPGNGYQPINPSEPPALYVIDTDKVSKSRIRQPFLKRMLDLKSLKPIHLDPHERRVFLKKYLKEEYSEFWLRVFEFWYQGKYRLFRRARNHFLRKRP